MPRRRLRSRAWSSSRALTRSTSRCTSATGIPTTITGSSTRSASSRARATSASIVRGTGGRFRRRCGSRPGRIVTTAEAAALVAKLRTAGRTIVFTNGVFDLLHPGHVRYLQQARALGDALIVGLNSDRSVRAIQGPSRPINPEEERAEVLAALACVDAVVVFDADTPHDLIAALQPDILVKGADWAADAIVGRDIVEARGGKVIRIPIEPGHGTSAIISRIREDR